MPESPGLRFSSLSRMESVSCIDSILLIKSAITLQTIGLSCRAAYARAFRSDCSASLSDCSTDCDNAMSSPWCPSVSAFFTDLFYFIFILCITNSTLTLILSLFHLNLTLFFFGVVTSPTTSFFGESARNLPNSLSFQRCICAIV